MSPTEQQNVWFGVAMFLIGLIAGAILTLASGNRSITGTQRDAIGTAPAAPQAPTAPQMTAKELVSGIARKLGLNESDFNTCLGSNKYDQLLAQQEAEGQQAGVNGTPGNILIDLKTGNARLISGAQPLGNFAKNIDEMLKNPTAKSTDPNTPDAKNVKSVDFKTDHISGSRSAPLALISYTDYQCPFCHKVHPTLNQILSTYDGKVMLVIRHFPLSFHPNAKMLGAGAECANELGGADAFWTYTDAVMTSDAVNN